MHHIVFTSIPSENEILYTGKAHGGSVSFRKKEEDHAFLCQDKVGGVSYEDKNDIERYHSMS